MKKILSIAMIFLIVLSTFSILAPQVKAEPDIAWMSATPLPDVRAQHASVAYDGRIYVLGGWQFAGSNTVYYSDVNPDGTISSWTSTTSLPEKRSETVAVAYNGYIYLLGGQGTSSPLERNQVWYAHINPDGSLGSWSSTTSLPYRSSGHAAFEWNGKIYMIGGWTGGSFRASTHFATINPDGTLGSWTSTSSLPGARGHGIAAVAHNGHAYALGGQGPPGTPNDDEADVWYAEINPDGTLDTWTATSSMLFGLETHGVAVMNDEIYVIGGVNQAMSPYQRAEVHRAPINPDGTLGDWTRDTDLALPIGIEPRGHLLQTPVWNNRIYVIGGTDETGASTDTVYYTQSMHAWVATTSLPNPSGFHHSAVHNDKIYVAGGSTGISGEYYDRVLYGSVQSDGHIDPEGWQRTTAPLPPDYTGQSERNNAPVVVYENWIYVLDGSAERPPHHIERDTVCFGSINPDGDITDWDWTTSMPYRGCEEAVQWNGRIYIMAGWTGYGERNDVWYAEINPADGRLSSWTKTTSLPRQICHGHSTTVHNGVIYFSGGHEEYPKHYAREVYYSIIQESGEVGPWIETALLPVPLDNHDMVALGEDLFIIGGHSLGTISDVVYKAHINSDGSLDSWEEYCVLPEPLQAVGSVVLNGRMYVIGGQRQDGSLVDTVHFTSIACMPTLHPAIKKGLESLSSLEAGILDGAGIVDYQTPGVAMEVAKTAVGFLLMAVPSASVLIYDLATHATAVMTAGELLERIKDVVDIDTFYEYYAMGDFSATIEFWKRNITENDHIFQDHAGDYSTDIEFINDLQRYHQSVLTIGNSFPDNLNDMVEAHEWEEFNRDLIFLAGGLVIIVVTWGAATPFVLAFEATYNGVTGIISISQEKDFYDALVDTLMLQHAEALHHAQRVADGLQYVANKLESGDLSFPQLRLEPFPGGGAWIWNEYEENVNVKLIHSVTLTCYDEQTIEPPRRHYEVPCGEFTIHPDSFSVFLRTEPPDDIIQWRNHLESFGYSVEEWSSLVMYYGEKGYHAMKTTPLPIREPMLSVVAESPVNLLVTDPSGLRTGYDYESHTVVNEITEATYSGPGTEPQAIIIPSPIDGIYTIEAFGTGAGTYTMTEESIALDGLLFGSQTYTGETVEGAVYVYTVSIIDETIITNPDPMAELEHLKVFIDGLPDGSFDKPKLESQRKKTLFNKIDEVILKVEAGNYTDAINKLFHDIRAKMDGDSTAQDWIIDPEMQSDLCVIIDHIISSIETCMYVGENGSSAIRFLLSTNMGDITIELYDDMPITTGNFKNLTQQGVYDDTIFHRVISGFMIQGGDPTGTGYGDPSIPTIPDEFTDHNRNDRGTVAMANRGPNTGSSQFFINLVDNNYLDSQHPVFGKVMEGMDVVDNIAEVETDENDRPLEEVRIIKAELVD